MLAAGLLFTGLSMNLSAQSQPAQGAQAGQQGTQGAQGDQNQRDRMSAATSMTGCLNKDTAGGYTLTDEKTGTKTPVAGSADLEKHSANHRVTLTGSSNSDSSGKSTFQVTQVQMLSSSCNAGSQ
jgi:hypothetical protein